MAIILLSGCIKQKTVEYTGDVKPRSNDSVVSIPKDYESESILPLPPVESTISGFNTTTNFSENQTVPLTSSEGTVASALPSSKLLVWTREGKIVDGVSSSTIIKDNEYWMYYTGMGIQLAKSPDGLNFVKLGTMIDVGDSTEKVGMVTNPAVFKTKDGNYRMIYEGNTVTKNKNDRKLYSAVSSDGLRWVVETGIRFQDEGDGKPGELFTSVPDILRMEDGMLRMYYTRGTTSAIAISEDEGIIWTKEKNLELGRIAVDPDVVRLEDGTYKLFFTTFDSEFGRGEQYMMSASSLDGINFVLDEGKRLRPLPENDMVVDPDIIKLPDGRYRMYYGESSNGMMFSIYSTVSAESATSP